MMIRKYRMLALVLFSLIGLSAFGAEKMALKSGDLYSCSLILRNADMAVVLLFGNRVEIPADGIKQISFEDSEDEFEIVLSDGTVLKGQIVDQDNDFYTIGTSAGLNTLEKAKIMEIRNPKLAQFYAPKKAESLGFHAGIFPSYSTVLGGFGSAYNTFWGAGIYAELGLTRGFWICLDSDFYMLTPQFASTNEIVFVIPVQLGFKYEGSFGEQGDAKNPLSNLIWSIKAGAGISGDVLLEQTEARTTAALGLSMAVSYGLKYSIMDFLSAGIGGKTTVVLEPSTYLLIQSVGVVIEFRF